MFKCFYCPESTEEFADIINHLIEAHPNSEIQLKRVEGKVIKCINYRISAELCSEQGRTITIDNELKKIHISRRNEIPKDSPLKKKVKHGNVETGTLGISDACEELSEVDLRNENDVVKDLVLMLPAVVKALADCGKLDDFIAFNKLVQDGKFPLDNIAFLLFLDVVRWFAFDKSTTFFRYNNECKLFWNTGYKLFRGRFLRFMSGPKNKYQPTTETNESPGNYFSENSKVNFVVPSSSILKDDFRMVPVEKPGIISKMIEKVSQNDPEQLRTYKICVDGKKINPSSKGEVDLWNHEPVPTFEMRTNRLKNETENITSALYKVERQIAFGHYHIGDVTVEGRANLNQSCRDTVTMLSQRLKDMREIKIGKEAALRKMQQQCEGDWRSSNYAIVISSLRTNIYQVENCIEDILNVNETLCEVAAISEQPERNFPTSTDEVSLQHQQNYVCLAKTGFTEENTSLIKQRSEIWHQLRDNCLVTGSTINKAIGLDGLKRQKSHIDIKAGRATAEPVSPELQNMFDYGSTNELNAVATLCSTFIPAFHPDASFHEEGCYVKKESETPYLIVSPDGSLRKQQNESCVLAAVEIKCPMPGKTFTTPVHYKLPHYYVTQVLSEMDSLNVDLLYFVSYSKQSTSIHTVMFDRQLWEEICSEVKVLDIRKTPKRLGPNVGSMKHKLKTFCQTNVSLVAELKSKTAKPCDHSIGETGRIHHAQQNSGKEVCLLKNVQKCFLRASESVKNCHKLCSQKAREVLVFLLADLDRLRKPEVPHAFPIAYALKGYSMKAEVMRKMIQEVLKELFSQGLYTPVVSYDGQWASLAFKSENGMPLTILELQKQVYNEMKKRRKSELTEIIFKTAIVKARSVQDLAEQTDFAYDYLSKTVVIAPKLGTNLLRTSSNMKKLLNNIPVNRRFQEPPIEPENTACYDTDYVFSAMSDELLQNLTSDEMLTISEVNYGAMNSPALEATETDERNNYEIESTDIAMFITDGVDSPTVEESDLTNISEHESISQIEITETPALETDRDKIIQHDALHKMLTSLRIEGKHSTKWDNTNIVEFEAYLNELPVVMTKFTKQDILKCLYSVHDILERAQLKFAKSWNKNKLAEFLHFAYMMNTGDEAPRKPQRRRTPDRLTILCKRIINKIPKTILNAIVAENVMPDRLQQWRKESPFTPITKIGNTEVTWFSCPEYNKETLSYIYAYIDVHHLITNCRIKVCKDGIPTRGIRKQAWEYVARANNTKLKVPHVEDLIDKQSDAIARQTFSVEVERVMSQRYPEEAHFCKLIRQFYEAEDDPGISANERCVRRLALRTWLLEGVNFFRFPPYGSHIEGIPNIMFQGFLTNIDRRLQLFPYVKCGTYNVRSLGSLEAENLFGQFQDLDPKGTGVVKAEEVPSALESACQLLRVGLQQDRPFHMTLSRQKVYPVHELLAESEMTYTSLYLYPSFVWEITIKDHAFDVATRGKRKAKRKLVAIAGPDEAARGVSGVRQFHKCDESKILPHKRLGIDL